MKFRVQSHKLAIGVIRIVLETAAVNAILDLLDHPFPPVNTADQWGILQTQQHSVSIELPMVALQVKTSTTSLAQN